MIYFTAHTFQCVCHCIRAMFRVLGVYNFGRGIKILLRIYGTIHQISVVIQGVHVTKEGLEKRYMIGLLLLNCVILLLIWLLSSILMMA